MKATLPRGERMIHTLAFAPDGKSLASGSAGTMGKPSAEVILWDVIARKIRAKLQIEAPTADALAFSPDSQLLAAAGLNSTSLRMWDVASGEEIFQTDMLPTQSSSTQLAFDNGIAVAQRQFDSGQAGIQSLTFNREGRQLVLGMADGTVRVWDIQSHEERGRSSSQKTSLGLALSADGKTLATIDRWGGIMLWGLPQAKR
jgi:WD40 repeat protein